MIRANDLATIRAMRWGSVGGVVACAWLAACGEGGLSAALYPDGAMRERAARVAISELRQLQETHRAQFGDYADLTGDAGWLPATAPGPHGVTPWTPTEATRRLGFEPDDATVAWQIQVFSGLPGTPLPGRGGGNRGSGDGHDDFWYVARVRGHFRSADRLHVLEVRSVDTEPVLLE